MTPNPLQDVYSPDEIARAAGVPEEAAVAAIGRADLLVSYRDAVRIGRALRNVHGARRRPATVVPQPLFSIFAPSIARPPLRSIPLVVSSLVHAAMLAFVAFLLAFTPRAATLRLDDSRAEPMRLVFLVTPGPGGGGGGGGLLQKAPPPKALQETRRIPKAISSPLPVRVPARPIVPAPTPPEPKPVPLHAERLPMIVAPIAAAPADTRTRAGVLEQTKAQDDSHGSGRGGGAGSGTGTGIGEGDGPGVGPGSGGGFGGGPYRPGSGITPPRLLKEVKADYTEDARRRGVEGEVVMEIVVRRDGLVGDVTVTQGLAAGLNERAVQAVRQWRFAPSERQGAPVDVMVEVSVEFKLR